MSVAALVAVTALHFAPATATAATAGTELLPNANFSKGTSGWSTTSSNQTLRVINTSSGKVAHLKVKKSGNAVLNDVPNSVTGVAKGTSYKVTAKVRTTIPKAAGVKGKVSVRELVAKSAVKTTQKSFTLSNKNWRTVSFTVTATRSGSSLDVRTTATKLHKSKNLQVKSVSVKTVASTTGSDSSDSATCSTRSLPKGTAFGTSISPGTYGTHQKAVDHVDGVFGTTVDTIRVFDGGMVFPWSHSRTKMIAGRDLIMSFRPMPQDVLAGKYDKEFKTWFQQAPKNVTIYWSYIHEPEPLIDQGKFTAAQYRKAWQRIDAIADSVCRSNMYPTLILTGWTASSGSKRDWRDYYPGSKVIEVMAFDPYNGVHEPDRDYYATPESLFGSVRAVAKEAGKPWAIAETGSRVIPSDQSPKGEKRAKWLTSLAKYSRDNGAVFVTYFHSTRDGEWRLLDKPSADAWKAAILSSP
ncbi:carbohydrate binding domain-containing protein [Leucobacter soli]|uniref:CBM-cenC domain-containing protein n=2 Tax=Leucobacter soli TaxID=2812850 RepID=A0A916JVH2_9MICO|nr:hypothetical protein LEUCIP111803_00970 [Leucobacter soli]